MRSPTLPVLLAVLATTLHAAAPSAETYVYLHQWPVEHARGVFTDGRGHVYATNVERDRLERYDRYGVMLGAWPMAAAEPGDLEARPHRLASAVVTEHGDFYALDGGAHRVTHYSADGTLLRTWGGLGSDPGRFSFPKSIALDGEGNVYVGDGWNARVQKFRPDGSFLLEFGGPGDGPGTFEHVTGIAIDDSGFVYVVDQAAHCVQKFDAAGRFLLRWGVHGRGAGEFDQPREVALDRHGQVYVSDRLNHRIQKFTPAGVFVTEWGTEGRGRGEMLWLDGLDVDDDGLVYVADHDRIQVFAPEEAVVRLRSRAGVPR